MKCAMPPSRAAQAEERQTVRDFQAVRCATRDYSFTEESLEIFGFFPPRQYWIPYVALFVVVRAFGVYVLGRR